MNKKLINILMIGFLITMIILIILSPTIVINAVLLSFKIWIYNLFPTLFPFFVISQLLISYGFDAFLSEILSPIMKICFNMRGNGAFVLGMSMISGFPGSAKYTKALYDNGSISNDEASKLLTFTHFANPLLLLGTIGPIFLNNYNAGKLILICHYSTNLIIGLIFRGYGSCNNEKVSCSLKKAICQMHNKYLLLNQTLGEIISNAIKNAIETLLMILGIITFFLMITSLINSVVPFNENTQILFNGFMEMTQGMKYVSMLNIPLQIKSTLVAMFISFGGFSVHIQILSIISNTKIKYAPYFIARLMHTLIAGIATYLLFNIFV